MNRFRVLLLLSLASALLSGCATNYYSIPRDVYEKKVRVLGVAPLLADADSDIRHPDKEAILKLVREANRNNEKELVEILRGTGEYSAVRLLDEDAGQVFTKLVSRRERRDDAGVRYNKYFYQPEELKKFISRHNVDAVLLVTVSGITMTEKIYSSNLLSYLEDSYNYLIMTGQILDAEGTMLWEYPNFRQQYNVFTPLLALQYPDFDEAKANVTDQVVIKNKTIAGIGRAFAKSESSSIRGTRQVGSLYNKQFTDMSSFLQYFRNPFVTDKAAKPAASAGVTAPSALPPAAPAAAPSVSASPPAQSVPGKTEPRQF